MPLPKNRIKIKCKLCLDEVEIIASRLNKSKNHFCSEYCRNTFCGTQRRKYPMVIGKCFYCQKDIVAQYAAMNKPNRKFCCRSCQTAWKNKNTPCSEKMKARASERIKKLWQSPQFREKMSSDKRKNILRQINSGQQSHFWIDGRTSESTRLRTSASYKQWRSGVFERDNYTCQICLKRNVPGLKLVLNADHIQPWSQFPDLRFDINNGRTLCLDCHLQTPTFGYKASQKNYLGQ